MTPRVRSLIGELLAALGVLILLATLGLYWWRPAQFGHVVFPMAAAAIIGYVGFYMQDPDGAKDGGGFLVARTVDLIAVVRSGRRSTDNAVVVAAPAVPAAPAPADPEPDK